MEEKVKLLPVVLEQSGDHEIKVACISFGYKNREILKLLDKRGDYLALGKFKEMIH